MDNQQLKARFSGQNIGCEVIISSKHGERIEKKNFGAVLGHRGNVYLSTGELAKYSDENWDIKLILRPLSSITKEELVRVFEAAGYDDPAGAAVYRLEERPMYGGEPMIIDSLGSNAGPFGFISAIDCLRSLGFCLPLNGKDPVKEGWAVLSE